MDAAIDNIAEKGPPEMAWKSIMPSAEVDNLEAHNEDQVNVRNLDSDDEDVDGVNDLDIDGGSNNCQEKDRKLDWRNTLSMLYAREARKAIMSTDDYCQHMWNLNSGQCQIVMYD